MLTFKSMVFESSFPELRCKWCYIQATVFLQNPCQPSATNTHTTTAGSVTLVKARVRLGVNVWVVCMMQQWAESVCWPHQWEQPIKCYRWIRKRLSVGGHSSPHFSLCWQRALEVSLKVLMSSEKMQRKLRSPSLIYAKYFFKVLLRPWVFD